MLSRFLQVATDDELVMAGGSCFQSQAVATAKAQQGAYKFGKIKFPDFSRFSDPLNGLFHVLKQCFRRIFCFKKWEPVRVLQVNFGTLDFMRLHDLYRWKVFTTCSRTNLHVGLL